MLVLIQEEHTTTRLESSIHIYPAMARVYFTKKFAKFPVTHDEILNLHITTLIAHICIESSSETRTLVAVTERIVKLQQ